MCEGRNGLGSCVSAATLCVGHVEKRAYAATRATNSVHAVPRHANATLIPHRAYVTVVSGKVSW